FAVHERPAVETSALETACVRGIEQHIGRSLPLDTQLRRKLRGGRAESLQRVCRAYDVHVARAPTMRERDRFLVSRPAHTGGHAPTICEPMRALAENRDRSVAHSRQQIDIEIREHVVVAKGATPEAQRSGATRDRSWIDSRQSAPCFVRV